MIQSLIPVILFLKILFRAYSFSPHVPVDIIRIFFGPEFIAENLKANKNQRKRSLILQYSSAQKTSLILGISTLLQTCFCLVSEKNICTAPFLDTQELLS